MFRATVKKALGVIVKDLCNHVVNAPANVVFRSLFFGGG